MSFLSKLFLFIIIAGPLAYLIYTQQNNIKNFLDRTLIEQQTPIETPTSTDELSPTSTIRTVAFTNSDIIITDSEGNIRKVGTLNQQSANTPKFIISDSRKFMIFEDLSGGTDLELRIYSMEQNVINSIGVFGTSVLLDMEFIANDRALILYGNPLASDEQSLTSYDIPSIYQNYETSADKWGNLWTGKFEKKLPITPVEGDYFDIVEMGKKVNVFGGTKEKPILRGEFAISDL